MVRGNRWGSGVAARVSFGFALIIATFVGNGCSLLFSARPLPSKVDRDGRLDCSESYGLPAVDWVIVGLEAFRTSLAIRANDADYRGSVLSRPSDIGIGIGLMALFAASSVYGYGVTNECQVALERQNAVLDREHEASRQRLRLMMRSAAQEASAPPEDEAAERAAQAKAFGEAARAASRSAAPADAH